MAGQAETIIQDLIAACKMCDTKTWRKIYDLGL
jgi:hypothetical protein